MVPLSVSPPSYAHKPPLISSVVSSSGGGKRVKIAVMLTRLPGARRDIRHPWAYMLLGQLVAMSVSTSLYITALFLHPTKYTLHNTLHLSLLAPLFIAFSTSAYLPRTKDNNQFLPNLLVMHLALLVPLFYRPAISPSSNPPNPKVQNAQTRPASNSRGTYVGLTMLVAGMHFSDTQNLIRAIPRNQSKCRTLYLKFLSHPAQASISFDVVWVAITLVLWWLVTGSTLSTALKSAAFGIAAASGVFSYTGVNRNVLISASPIALLAIYGFGLLGMSRLRSRNAKRRRQILDNMGIQENAVVPGTSTEPPKRIGSRTVIGFWHPYWWVRVSSTSAGLS